MSRRQIFHVPEESLSCGHIQREKKASANQKRGIRQKRIRFLYDVTGVILMNGCVEKSKNRKQTNKACAPFKISRLDGKKNPEEEVRQAYRLFAKAIRRSPRTCRTRKLPFFRALFTVTTRLCKCIRRNMVLGEHGENAGKREQYGAGNKRTAGRRRALIEEGGAGELGGKTGAPSIHEWKGGANPPWVMELARIY